IVRFDAQGALDTTFGTSGIAPAAAVLRGLAIGPDGSIVAGAEAGLIRRWTSAGAPDGTFAFTSKPAVYHDVIALSDCTVADAGQANGVTRGVIGGFAVTRASASGAADATFANQGTFLGTFAGSDEMSNGAVVQSDGKIVVATSAQSSPPALVRFTV